MKQTREYFFFIFIKILLNHVHYKQQQIKYSFNIFYSFLNLVFSLFSSRPAEFIRAWIHLTWFDQGFSISRVPLGRVVQPLGLKTPRPPLLHGARPKQPPADPEIFRPRPPPFCCGMAKVRTPRLARTKRSARMIR